jgi:putative transposase
MIVTRCFKYRLYPSIEQETTLIQWAGCRRFVWNWALRRKQDHYRATKKGLGYSVLAAELTQLKREPDHIWLQACVAQVLQQVLMDLETAFTNFFEKRTKYPRWKSRKRTLHSMRFPQGVTVVNDHTITVPKLGLLRAIIHRPLKGTVKGATIKQASTGAWYVVFVCHIDRPEVIPTCNNPIGIDVGLESFTTLHTGTKVAPPKFYRRGERKINRLQRRLSRAQKGSNNRKKAKRRLANAYQRIRNQRSDWLHKHAFSIIRKYDTVCIETLNIRGLVKTKLAKSFSDAALGTFMRILEHKAEWYGRQLIRISQFFPSSKQCHCCGAKIGLTLADRIWLCDRCGTTHDRDINAAINILHEGLWIVAAGQSRH